MIWLAILALVLIGVPVTIGVLVARYIHRRMR
jgi:hypothetical protein